MPRTQLFATAFSIILSGLPVATASAAVSYSYETDATMYDASSGTVHVQIFLRETLTDGSLSVIDGDGGLVGAGFQVVQTAGSGINFSTFKASASFDGPSKAAALPSVTGNTYLVSAFDSPVMTNAAARIPLATIDFVSTAGSGNAMFELARKSTFTGTNTLTATSFYDLDNNSDSPAFSGVGNSVTPFQISVPEPAALLSLALPMALLMRRNRSTSSWKFPVQKCK